MTVPPLSEAHLYDILLKEEADLRPKAERMWAVVKIEPKRWTAPGYGSGAPTFWAIGLFGKRVIWYNEIECEFTVSDFKKYGEIGEGDSPCQNELSLILEYLIRRVEGEQAHTS
ncbi:hypothetical protein [Pelagibius sp.]|uniref:hypothetical protein n=1 Tax=Pelagibius sp. TaxID=1931238 RepID=UPI003B5109C2